VSHACPRPECDRDVSDEMFACRPDWYALPADIRQAIWATWRNGDELGHVRAMADALTWYREHPPKHRAARTPGETGDPL
jgi:hypothetical protein